MRPIVAAALALAVVLAGCSAPRQRLARLFDEYWDETMRRNPTWATSLGDHRYDDRLPDLSAEARHEWEGELEDFLGTLRSIPVAKLSAADRLNHRIFERVCEYELSRLLTRSYLIPLNQMDGPHLALPMLQVSHPFETYEDYINYAKRLEAFPDQVEQIVANMEEGRRAGHVAPRVNIVPVITQIESQLVVDPVDSVLFDPLDQVSSALSEDQQKNVRHRVMAAIGQRVVPSYRRLLTYLTDTYMPACRDTVGIYDVPGGAAIYVRRTRLETTTDLTPQEIHQIGLAEVARLRGAMDRVRLAMGFEGELDAFMDHLRSQPEFFAKTGDELVQRCNDCLRRAEAAMPQLFGRLPVASCEMKEIESYRAVSAPVAYYNPPAEDFSRPGYYYINTYEPTKRPLYSLEALTYHEAVPGHHLQIALDQENTSLPRFRRYAGFTAYVEGWALYGESLGAEIGGYADPLSEFGRYNFNMWRACRLVVDTGMHHKKWTRQRAIDFMMTNTALAQLDVEAEIDRYIAWPGQALAYKIGELTILRIRADAEQRLGDRFDIRAFHDALLSGGAMPLGILETRMAEWAEDQLGG